MSQYQMIQWFPGHMTKAFRKIKEQLNMVDVVVEVIDSRVPISSRNPDLDDIVKRKPRILIMNKIDMSDPIETDKWIQHYKEKGIMAIPLNCKTGNEVSKVPSMIRDFLHEKIAMWKSKGMQGRTIKVIVLGIPNVGKSTFINKLTSSSKAKVEDRPGVTRGNQWFSIKGNIDLLDTPGVLWPKFEDESVGENLAFIGSIKDNVIDIESLAVRLLAVLLPKYSDDLESRFKINLNDVSNVEPYECLKLIAKKRGMLIKGGGLDTERAAIMLIDEFRSAKIGRITLERLS